MGSSYTRRKVLTRLFLGAIFFFKKKGEIALIQRYGI